MTAEKPFHVFQGRMAAKLTIVVLGVLGFLSLPGQADAEVFSGKSPTSWKVEIQTKPNRIASFSIDLWLDCRDMNRNTRMIWSYKWSKQKPLRIGRDGRFRYVLASPSGNQYRLQGRFGKNRVGLAVSVYLARDEHSPPCWTGRSVTDRWVKFSIPRRRSQAEQAAAGFFSGYKPKRWSAKLRVKNNHIDSFRLVLPVHCADGTSTWSTLTRPSGKKPRIPIRANGRFYLKTVTRWGESVFRGQLKGNTIVGMYRNDDYGLGDGMPCWPVRKGDPWARFIAKR